MFLEIPRTMKFVPSFPLRESTSLCFLLIVMLFSPASWGNEYPGVRSSESENPWADWEISNDSRIVTASVSKSLSSNSVTAASSAGQSARPHLEKAATSAPYVGSFEAPGNLTLAKNGSKRLPPVRLDSFVEESGRNDRIYGNEGAHYSGFERENRISAGFHGARDAGLTTGHGSFLPSAWGRTEESSFSGPNGNL